VTREFAEVRLELRRLREDVVARDVALRRDIAALAERVDRLERRWAQE
jgi:polyhydroxyalkanoate synthesis regulator phasin